MITTHDADTPQLTAVRAGGDEFLTVAVDWATHSSESCHGVRLTGRGGAGELLLPLGKLEHIRAHEASRGPTSPPSRLSRTNPTPQAEVHGARGGAPGTGNIIPGPAPAYERARHSEYRGSLANLTASPTLPVNRPVHHPGAVESTGGAGTKSRSREHTSENAARNAVAAGSRGYEIACILTRTHIHLTRSPRRFWRVRVRWGSLWARLGAWVGALALYNMVSSAALLILRQSNLEPPD
ncbi:hypothetical protein B0H11DRAFT_2293801 [Mycena galericulata]|nr:hypothetical protein B0H11DRAFT_2293801 [Mycena galericulata]